jgi:hypothetical protein
MTDRRDLLKLIGLGAAGSTAGCSMVADEVGELWQDDQPAEGSEGTDDPDSGGPRSELERTLSAAATTASGAPRPDHGFDYGRREVSVDDSDTFREIRARSARTRPGDRMRVVPSERSPAELRQLLETVWGISERSTQVDATVDGETLTFAGGEGPQVVALTAVHGDAVLVARGEDLETVESLAGRWPDGL